MALRQLASEAAKGLGLRVAAGPGATIASSTGVTLRALAARGFATGM
jgi:hypothetical protein